MEAQVVRRNPVFMKSRDLFAVTLNPHQPDSRKVIMVALDRYSGRSGATSHLITFELANGNIDEIKAAVLSALGSRLHKSAQSSVKFHIKCPAALGTTETAGAPAEAAPAA